MGKPKKLDNDQAAELLRDLPGWTSTGQAIVKTYVFEDYHQTIAFVNATAAISNREDHHPDLEVGYDKVVVRYSTHAAGGLTQKDFDCAAKVETLKS